MKTILIMRHGEAGPLQNNDSLRELTAQGTLEAKNTGEWIAKHYAPQAVIVSPYVRAQQTAKAVLMSKPVAFNETCSDIIPSGNASLAGDYLETLMSLHPDFDTWLLVSHMPIVSYLVEHFCPEKLPIFSTASVAVIKYNPETHLSEFIEHYSNK